MLKRIFFIVIVVGVFLTLTLYCVIRCETYDGKAAVKQEESPSLIVDTAIINHYKPVFENKTVVEIFVSPLGNDTNIGNKQHPLHTPQKVRDVLRHIKAFNHKKGKSYIVTFLEGSYYFNQTFLLDSLDGGLGGNPILYRGEDGKQVIFSGGKTISTENVEGVSEKSPAWNKLNKEVRRHIKVVDLKKTGISDYGSLSFRGFGVPLVPSQLEVFINDQSMTLARWPNEGYLKIDEVKDSVNFICDTNRIDYWKDEKNVWALGFWKFGWAEHRVAIKNINQKNNQLTLAHIPVNKNYMPQEGNQWFAYNILSELDTAGEYYLDQPNGLLYFMYPEGIDAKIMNIDVSVFGNNNEPLLKIESAHHINIQNIVFKNSKASGIEVKNSEHINIDNCIVKNVGTYGISLDGKNCCVSNSEVFNAGAHGISVSGGDRKKLIKANNVVENCLIHHLGRINITHGYGIKIEGVGTTVRNCDIYNTPCIAIHFKGNYHTIEKNKIHNVCYELDDSGAIYCGRDWAMYGNLIKNNIIHNIVGSRHVIRNKSIHGVYLDDCASGITVSSNIFYRVLGAGVLNGGGRDNKIENNIFVKCRWALRGDRRADLQEYSKRLYENLKKIDYEHPPWSTVFPQLTAISERRTKFVEFIKLEYIVTKFPEVCNALNIAYSSDYVPIGCTFSGNIIYSIKGDKYMSDTRTSQAKRPSPFFYYTIENNLIEKNPHFVDEENLNLDLLDDSPAYSISGFERIPFEQIGVLKN